MIVILSVHKKLGPIKTTKLLNWLPIIEEDEKIQSENKNSGYLYLSSVQNISQIKQINCFDLPTKRLYHKKVKNGLTASSGAETLVLKPRSRHTPQLT